MKPEKQIRIGTRRSTLAGRQTELVTEMLGETLRRYHPDISVRVIPIDSSGDIDRSTPLPQMGGAGAFTSRLERALIRGQIDIAVHSLKDLPTAGTDGLLIAAIPERTDCRDVLVSRDNLKLAELPSGALIGTSSVRRAAQLRLIRPDLRISDIRGNVETRIEKVRRGEFAGTILAAAGIGRLDLMHEAAEVFEVDVMLPAPGQAALAVQCRRPHGESGSEEDFDDQAILRLCRSLDCASVRVCVEAERHLLSLLQAGCSAPVGAHASSCSGAPEGTLRVPEAFARLPTAQDRDALQSGPPSIVLLGGLFAEDGSEAIRLSASGTEGRQIAETLADEMFRRGGSELLRAGAKRVGSPRGRPLSGKRVFLSRAPQDAKDACRRIEAAGGEAICISLIERRPCPDDEFNSSIEKLSQFDWLLFTSSYAVACFFDSVSRDTPLPRVAAVGPATAHALSQHDVRVDFQPGEALGEALARELPLREGERILFPRGNRARDATVELLEKRGALCSAPLVYETLSRTLSSEEEKLILDGSSALLLTSGSSAESLSVLCSRRGVSPRTLFSGRTILCIGPQCADVARENGVPVTAVAPQHTLAGLVDFLIEITEREEVQNHE